MFRRELLNSRLGVIYSVEIYRATLQINEGKYVANDYRRQRCSAMYMFESSNRAAMEKAAEFIEEREKKGYEETEESKSYRIFEQSGEKGVRFWRIRLIDDTCVVHFGKHNDHPLYATSGRWQTKYFESEPEALAHYHKVIAKKLQEGYVEKFKRKNEYSTPPKNLVKPKRAVDKKKAKPAARKTAKAKADGDAPRRELTFDDGKSRKFWNIELGGTTHTVQFGRIGTNGQTKPKEFDTKEKAKASFDKLVEEKLKKGYQEQEVTAASTTKAPAVAKESAQPKRSEPMKVEPRVVTEVTHTIDLKPKDWFWAMWRDPDPLEQPQPREFDLETCLDQLRKVRSASAFKNVIPTDPLSMSAAEGEFWLTANRLREKESSPRKLAAALAKKQFTGQLTLDDFVRRQKKDRPWRIDLVLPILGPHDFTKLLLAYGTDQVGSGAPAFKRWVVPYLSRKEREELRKFVAAEAKLAKTSSNPNDYFPISVNLAGSLGCHEIVQQVVAAYPKHHYLLDIIWGLGSANEVEREVDRIRQEDQMWWPRLNTIAWLAHTEASRLDLLRDSVMALSKSWGGQAEQADILTLVKDPAAAQPILELRLAGKAAEIASAWLDEQVGNAITGLVPVAIGKGALADAAKAYLREKHRMGFGELIEKALKQVPSDQAQRLRETTLNVAVLGPPLSEKNTPKKLKPLLAEASALQPLKDGQWADISRLPPIPIGKNQLSREQLEKLVLALQHSEFESVHPLIVAVRELSDSDSLAEFAWSLFDVWLAQGAPSKHKWAMRALGHFGNDDTALKLTPLVRAWPGESQHPRAVLGVDCLRAIGSDTALMQLSGIAQKVKFKALQRKAMECVEQIAAEKGMSRDELEDRVVPDCGLDERGTRIFDFGARKFTFALGADNKPVIRDEEGKLRKDLPKPTGNDNNKLADQSIDDWKQLKKQIREVLKIQNARLERALITGRRWPTTDFESLLVRHPLMTNLAQRLLWAGFDKRGKRNKLFRLTEERDYADSDDQQIALDQSVEVGLVHPLHITESERSVWSELLADYEIVPPFAQLGRPIHRLDSAAAKKNSFTRFEGHSIPALKLLGLLDRGGWTRGMPQDNGVFREHYKHFYTADITAVVTYEHGIGIGFYGQEEDQVIDGCFFVPGIYKPVGWPDHKRKIKLSQVDPVVVSEVMIDLMEIEAKAV